MRSHFMTRWAPVENAALALRSGRPRPVRIPSLWLMHSVRWGWSTMIGGAARYFWDSIVGDVRNRIGAPGCTIAIQHYVHLPFMYLMSTSDAMHHAPCTIHHAPCHAPCTMPCTMHHAMQHAPCHAACTMPYSMHHAMQHAPYHAPCHAPCTIPCTMNHTPCHAPCTIGDVRNRIGAPGCTIAIQHYVHLPFMYLMSTSDAMHHAPCTIHHAPCHAPCTMPCTMHHAMQHAPCHAACTMPAPTRCLKGRSWRPCRAKH